MQTSPIISTLYLQGEKVSEQPPTHLTDNFAKAVMIDGRMQNDPYVMNKVHRLLKKRINQAKIGVLNVAGNYSILAGDPYILCEKMFNMELKGILEAGEFYSKYWLDRGAEKIACFRPPMVCHNSVLVRTVSKKEEAKRWYRYMNTITVLNGWDTSCHASCGSDFDSDMFMTSNNEVLIRCHKELPAILCEQANAKKIIPTENDIVEANIRVFNTNVGAITNRGTSRLTLAKKFDKDSKEAEVLRYRTISTQLLQQECIDAVKSAILKPESKTWYVRSVITKSDMSDEDKKLYLSTCSDKRPYFFRYIYPIINKDYVNYINNTNRKALRLFRKEVSDLMETPPEELTDDERRFLYDYEKYDPVLEYPCTMNRICWAVEEKLDHYIPKHKNDVLFDYTIMRSDGVEYTTRQYSEISKLYKQYRSHAEELSQMLVKKRIKQGDINTQLFLLRQEYRKLCLEKCSEEEVLCNILLDLCYKHEYSKSFVWDICSSQIIKNLLKHNDNKINMPVLDENGEIEFRGHKYRLDKIDYPIEEDEDCTFMSEVTEEDIMPLNINSTAMETQISA